MATPLAGPKNSTRVIPTIDSAPQRRARQLGDSWKNTAPAGRRNSGLIAAMNSAWAMLVRVIAVKNVAMLTPKNRAAGSTVRHVAALGNDRSVRSRTTTITVHQAIMAPIIRQKAMTDPVDPDHLISGELTEKLTMATAIAISPSERDRAGAPTAASIDAVTRRCARA